MESSESLLISVVAQLPIVALFVWFILKWTDKLEKASEERNQKRLEFQEKQEELWRQDAQKREQLWREFLAEERQHRAEAIGRLAEEIKAIGIGYAGLRALLERHDERADTFIDSQMQQQTEKK